MSNQPHSEWREENSLTAPSDRDRSANWRPNQSAPPLTDEETKHAMRDLISNSFVSKFPAVERKYADPPVTMQNFGLISFVPAKGATPNEKGIYGFAKLRGNFATTSECDEQAERIIRNVDSYHKIYVTPVGRPFPLTLSSDYSAEKTEVDIRKDIAESISHDVKSKREKDESDMNEIKNREKALLEDVSRKPDDPKLIEDTYITLRVKKAQLSWTFLENEKKLREIQEIIIKTRREIAEMEEGDATLKTTYYQKYMEARAQAGLKVSSEDNFIKYMAEDAPLPF
jgi:hypothetical protein